jgi:PDZ domain-containing secreted protein
MMNNGNYIINNGDDNGTWSLPPPTLEHVMAIQGQPFQTMVLMQQAILRIQSTDERTQSRKRKNDTQGDASHTLDEWTKKQLKISVAQQVDYDKQI